MTQQILILSGKKQSGKSSASNFLHGLCMKAAGSTREFSIDDEGRLHVLSAEANEAGDVEEFMAILDIERDDDQFAAYASKKIWPFVRCYSYADTLKSVCMQVFGLSEKQCYGTDDEKNSETHIKWSDVGWSLPPRTKGEYKKNGKLEKFMTGREFMQHFGTNICRKVKDDCWLKACMNAVVADGAALAIITDARFPNEIDIAKEYGAKTIRFNREEFPDEKHSSETALDGYKPSQYDLFIENSDITIHEKNELLLAGVKEWGMFPDE